MRTSLTLLPTLLLLAIGCRNTPEPVDADADGVLEADDCNDADAAVFPGADELCNGVDDNCDGLIDENATDATTFFQDADSDGFGATSKPLTGCDAPSGYVTADADCDDLNASTFPGANEDDCTDPVDHNCDGSVGYADADADGFPACLDCDDTAAAVNPDARELCDGLDNNCDGDTDEAGAAGEATWYADADADGQGNARDVRVACDQPTGYVSNAEDCNDAAAASFLGGVERCDGLDNDCDGTIDLEATDAATWYHDGDLDEHGNIGLSVLACAQPVGFVASSDDCDDNNPTAYPSATEVCDEADNNCDGAVDEGVGSTWYQDGDRDGHGLSGSSQSACSQPAGFVASSDDCNDTNPTAYPGATEVCDEADNNCDNAVDEGFNKTWYLDYDGDSYGKRRVSVQSCSQPSGFVADATDCDDLTATTNPGASELCNGVDDDCDTKVDDADDNLDLSTATESWSDLDLDGYGDASTRLQTCVPPVDNVFDDTDCDDGNVDAYPGAPDAWYDGVDTNCDGANDFDQDGDGHDAQAYGGDDEIDTDASCWTGCIGMAQTSAGDSCDAIHTVAPGLPSGTYWVDTDADGDKSNAREAYCDMDNLGGGWTECFSFTNTPAEDLIGNAWFDQCVTDSMGAGTGAEVRVELHNDSGQLLYDHFGARPSAWTFDNLTSTTHANGQYYSCSHDRLVPLDNGDKLMITGRFSTNSGCGGSYGNGYGITVYPASPDYYSNPKMFVGSYRHVPAYGGVRSFNGWSMSGEISGTGNASYNSCQSTPPQLGTFAFYVR